MAEAESKLCYTTQPRACMLQCVVSVLNYNDKWIDGSHVATVVTRESFVVLSSGVRPPQKKG